MDTRTWIRLGATAGIGALLAIVLYAMATALPEPWTDQEVALSPLPDEPEEVPAEEVEPGPEPPPVERESTEPGSDRAVSCGVIFLSEAAEEERPPLDPAEIIAASNNDDDIAIPVDVYRDRISFDPPEDVSRGILRSANYLESPVQWSSTGCSHLRLRVAAEITGRISPPWGDLSVVGCGTTVSVEPDGRFELRIAEGDCMLRAVRDDDGVPFDSDIVEIEARWEEPLEVELFFPED